MEVLVTHFTLNEFACNCARERKQCSCPTWYVSSRLVGTLELTRRLLGVPIYVSSGFRCPERNFHVGGSPHSRHMNGLAADVHVKHPDADYDALVAIARVIVTARPDAPAWELIPYPDRHFLHLAAPRNTGSPLWDGGKIAEI